MLNLLFFHRALNVLLCRAKILRLPIDLVLELFQYTVIPVLLYGCEVWGLTDLQQVEVFHKKFLKRILAVGFSTGDGFVYGETGSMDLKGMILSRMAGFWLGIINGRDNKISAVLYRFCMRMHLSADSPFVWSWASSLEERLEELGMIGVFHDGGFGYSPTFIKQSIQLRSLCLFDLNWQSLLATSGSYAVYRHLKPVRCLSPYLVELPYHERRTVTRFISRCNFLPCSDFRRHRDATVDISCSLCHLDEDGDEPHFVFRCPYFAGFRDRNPDIPLNGESVEDLANLLQTPDISVLRRLTVLFAAIMDIHELFAVGQMGGVQVPEDPVTP